MRKWSEFDQNAADEICARLMDGQSLRMICRDPELPSERTVFNWLSRNPDFVQQYARAREVQADTLFDEILEIADDGSNDWMERKDKEDQSLGWRENGEAVRRSVLRVDARKWMAGKLAPKKYGDKSQIEHAGPDGGPIPIAYTDDQRAAALMAFLAKAGKQD